MQQPNVKLIKRIFISIAAIVVLLIGYQIYQSLHFKVVSTSPKTSDVSIDSPYLKINFNRTLSSAGLKLSSSPSVISSYSVSDKALTINLKYPLNSSTDYSVSINTISDTKGERLYNKAFKFKPKYVPYNSLSTDQQKTVLQNQTKYAPPKTNLNFVGIDSLSEHGITTAQTTAFEKAVYSFSASAQSAVIDTNSVTRVPHDPSSSSDKINFNLKIDDQAYRATITYSHLTTVRLVLFDATSGNQVYDSGNVKGN